MATSPENPPVMEDKERFENLLNILSTNNEMVGFRVGELRKGNMSEDQALREIEGALVTSLEEVKRHFAAERK